jgi:hypothetical protein
MELVQDTTRPDLLWDKSVLSIRLDTTQLSDETVILMMILLRHQHSMDARENFA